jgi:hypothetical protein
MPTERWDKNGGDNGVWAGYGPIGNHVASQNGASAPATAPTAAPGPERVELTESELVAAILAATVRITDGVPPGAMTIAQLQAETSMGAHKLRRIIGQMQAQGRVRVIYIWREGIDGHQHQVPVYKLSEGK